jgi:hypothetical protein
VQIGPVLDAIFQHVDNPPPRPVATSVEAFVRWAAAHSVQPAGIYTAYPNASVQETGPENWIGDAESGAIGANRPGWAFIPRPGSTLAVLPVCAVTYRRTQQSTPRVLDHTRVSG